MGRKANKKRGILSGLKKNKIHSGMFGPLRNVKKQPANTTDSGEFLNLSQYVQEDTPPKEKIDLLTVPYNCRLCLREITSFATPIWGKSGIYEMVIRCCPVTVLETDKFQFVCVRCKHHLDCIDKFQKMCLKSNEIFLKMTLIKLEDPFSNSLNEGELVIEPPSVDNLKLEGTLSYKHELPIEPTSVDNFKLEGTLSYKHELPIEPPSVDNFKLEETLSYEHELVIEPPSEKDIKFGEIYSYGDELVNGPLSEYNIKFEEIHYHGDEKAIDAATNFETEDETEQEYLCKKCPMISFKKKDSLIHQKSHMQTKRVRPEKRKTNLCPICGKTLTVLQFEQHLASHTHPPQRKECDQCGKMYSGPSALRAHKLRHLPFALHECTLCGFKLRTKKDLNRHVQTVHCPEELKISCTYCDRKFRCRHNMRVHLRTHTGEMPYSCPDCGISFAHRVTMKLHRLKEHKVDMFLPPIQKKLKTNRRKRTNKMDDAAPTQDA